MRVMKIVAALICTLALSVSAAGILAAAGAGNGGTIIHNTYGQFVLGAHENTRVTEAGAVELLEGEGGYAPEGTYISPETETPAFDRAVISWNADTPKGTSIGVEVRARVGGEWSEWLVVGVWRSGGARYSASSEVPSRDSAIDVDVDTLTVGNGLKADCFCYRLTLTTDSPSVTPSVRLVAGSFRTGVPDEGAGEGVGAGSLYTQSEVDAFTGVLPVTPVSQMTRDPQFNNVICAAVSTAMVLGYKGVDILPEMAAMGVLDTNYGYGNWAFNAAFIGSYGLESYVRYCRGLDDVKRELMQGNPVVCSVRYKKDAADAADLPVVSNAPIDRTFGHLLVVTGYTRQNGVSYVAVNDPAAPSDGEVFRLYEESQFMAAWAPSGMAAYVVHGYNGGGTAAPAIKEAVLRPTGNTKEENGRTVSEYALETMDGADIQYGGAASAVVWAAGKVHSYAPPMENGRLWLDGVQGGMPVYIFLSSGEFYAATFR